MKKQRIHFHGELYFLEIAEVPVEAKPLEVKGDLKLADSENTGNHHMLKVIPGVEVFGGFDEKFYVKTCVDTKAYCVLQDRHDDMPMLAKSTWEIGKSQEYDHVERMKRSVLD